MSVEQMAVVLHHSRSQCTAKVVLLGIANHDGDGGAWPTIETLMKYTNGSRRSVQDALAVLVDLGELRVHLNKGGTVDWRGDKRPNRYEILVQCPADCDHTTNHRPRIDGVRDSAPGKTDGVQDNVERGAESRADGVRDSAPKPSLEPSLEPSLFVVPELPTQTLADEFAEFWKSWPRKSDKGHAEKAFRSARRKVPYSVIIDGLHRTMHYITREDGRYIPLGATWLNGERWADEVDPAPNSAPERRQRIEPPDGLSPEECNAWYESMRRGDTA